MPVPDLQKVADVQRKVFGLPSLVRPAAFGKPPFIVASEWQQAVADVKEQIDGLQNNERRLLEIGTFGLE